MDLEERTAPSLRDASPAALAAVALVIEIAIAVIPWSPAGSFLSVAISGVFSIAIKLANLLQLFAGAFAIAAGIWVLRRGHATFAAGMFVAAAIVLGVHVVAGLLETTEGWIWQTFAVLGLQGLETVLLLLAASRVRRHEPAATSVDRTIG